MLREMGHVYPDEIRQFIVQNMADLSIVAFSRAIERRLPDLRAAGVSCVQRRSFRTSAGWSAGLTDSYTFLICPSPSIR